MSDFVCCVGNFKCLGGGGVSNFRYFGSWGRQVWIWASRGRFQGPTPGESLLVGHHFGAVFGHFWVLFLMYFLGRRLDHVFDDFGMVPGSILGSRS